MKINEFDIYLVPVYEESRELFSALYRDYIDECDFVEVDINSIYLPQEPTDIREAYPKEELPRDLPLFYYIFHRKEEAPVGFTSLYLSDKIFLHSIYVLPDQRHQGIGTVVLLDHFRAHKGHWLLPMPAAEGFFRYVCEKYCLNYVEFSEEENTLSFSNLKMRLIPDSDIDEYLYFGSGVEQKVACRFVAKGQERYIPSLYFFPENVVFDIVTKGRDVQDLDLSAIELNGARVRGWSSSGKTDSEIDETYLSTMRFSYGEYVADGPFSCRRVCLDIEAEQAKSLSFKIDEDEIVSKLELTAEISSVGEKKTLELTVPTTKTHHKVTVELEKTESVELPHIGRKMDYAIGSYVCEPPLPDNCRLIFDSSVTYEAAAEPVTTYSTWENKYSLQPPAARNAAAIGIIGGADGPTAVFISNKLERPQKLYCTGLPSANDPEAWVFKLKSVRIGLNNSEEHILKF